MALESSALIYKKEQQIKNRKEDFKPMVDCIKATRRGLICFCSQRMYRTLTIGTHEQQSNRLIQCEDELKIKNS